MYNNIIHYRPYRLLFIKKLAVIIQILIVKIQLTFHVPNPRAGVLIPLLNLIKAFLDAIFLNIFYRQPLGKGIKRVMTKTRIY